MQEKSDISSAISSRMSRIRESVGLSQSDFGDRIGLSRGSVTRIESATQLPGADILVRVCTEFEISGDWLLTGKGQMADGETKNKSSSRSHTIESADQMGRVESSTEQIFDKLSRIGSRGYQAELWYILRVLGMRFPDSMSPEELKKALIAFERNPTVEAVQDSLLVLREAGLINASTGEESTTYTYNRPMVDVRTRDLVHDYQLATAAVHDLVERILPVMSQHKGRGQIVNSFLRIPEGEGKAIVREVVDAVRKRWSEAARNDGPEEVLLVLGVAVTSENSC